MKKFLILFIFTIFSLPLMHAQSIIGGGVNLSLNSTSNGVNGSEDVISKQSSFSLSPKAGYFLSDDWLLGADFSLSFSRNKNLTTDPDHITKGFGLGFTPFLRYYAFRKDRLSLFGQAYAGASYSVSKTEQADPISDSKSLNFQAGLVPGVAWDVSERLQLEALVNAVSLHVNRNVSKNYTGAETSQTTTSFGFGGDMDNLASLGNISIGVIFKL
jgi:outer membrane protein assembly factor BamA